MRRCSRKSVGRRGGRGFTLVELVVTIAVVAIVATLAMPSLSDLIRGNRLTSAANEMVAMLQTARVAAISNRASVAVCPSADGATCAAAIGNRWIAVMTKDGVATVLRDSALHAAVSIKASANLAAGNNRFTFLPSGFSVAGAGAGGNASGTIGFCVAQLRGNNDIDVSASVGRISTARRAATAACATPADN